MENNTFVLIGKDGKFAWVRYGSSFALGGKQTLTWTNDINDATVFNEVTFRQLPITEGCVFHKIPAKEIRKVEIVK